MATCYKIVEPYFQDDWRATQHLTLNLGIRISLFGTYREKYRQAFNFDPRFYDPAGAPVIDVEGSATQQPGALIPGVGNPGYRAGCREFGCGLWEQPGSAPAF